MEDDQIEEVQLDLDVDEPPAPQPDVVEESAPATEAFARLEGEMAMVRHTVQTMARERADTVVPDYRATLGQMADQLAKVSKTLTVIGHKPAIGLTPDDIKLRSSAPPSTCCVTAATCSGRAGRIWTMQPVSSLQLSGGSAPTMSRSVRPGALQAWD